MIIRVRTNLATVKIDVAPTATLQELSNLIQQKLSIEQCTQPLSLSRDIFGRDPIDSDDVTKTLDELNLRHGDELHILDRFEHFVIEKDYINDNHELVKAGKRARVLEYFHQPKKEQAVAAPPPETIVEAVEQHQERQPPHKEDKIPADAVTATPVVALPALPEEALPASFAEAPVADNAAAEFNGLDEDDVRIPDEIQRMQLIEPMSPALQRPLLTPEDYRQLGQLRKQLIEAGIPEDIVEQQIEEETNSILSERAINQMKFEDRVGSTFGIMTSLEELEQLLMTRRAAMPITTGTRSVLTVDESTTLRGGSIMGQASPTRPKFNDLLRQTGQSVVSGRAAPSSGHGSSVPQSSKPGGVVAPNANERAVAAPSIARNGSGSAPSAFAQICTNGADLAKAATNKKASALPNIRSTRPANNSAAAIAPLLISGKTAAAAAAGPVASGSGGSGDRARPPPVPAIGKEPANARKGSGMAAAGAGALRPTPTSSAPSSARSSAPSSAPNSAPNSARGVERPVVGGRQVVRRRSKTGDEPPAASTPTTQVAQAAPAAPAAAKPGQGAPPRPRLAAGAAIAQQARRAAAAVAAPPEPAAVRAPPGNAAMRNFLAQDPRNAPTQLPAELQREINRGIENDLLQLAQRESRALANHNDRARPQPTTETPPNCYYDEEDELLAQALQASMEDF